MPGGRPFLRSASFCGNSGTMKASLVSAACKAVDAMKIARAKVAETAKDLARRTVMYVLLCCFAAPAPTGAFPHRDESLHASRGPVDRGAVPHPFNERRGRLFALGRSEWGASCYAHTDVIAPDEQHPALFDALSLGSVFVDRAIWSECVEHEGKGDVVGDVD